MREEIAGKLLLKRLEAILFIIKEKEKVDYNLLRAKNRHANVKEVQKEKRVKNPKYKRPDIPDSNSEIENLEKKLEHYDCIISILLFTVSSTIESAYDKEYISKEEFESLIDTYNKLGERYNNKEERK